MEGNVCNECDTCGTEFEDGPDSAPCYWEGMFFCSPQCLQAEQKAASDSITPYEFID
jgi:hypothetical protein